MALGEGAGGMGADLLEVELLQMADRELPQHLRPIRRQRAPDGQQPRHHGRTHHHPRHLNRTAYLTTHRDCKLVGRLPLQHGQHEQQRVTESLTF